MKPATNRSVLWVLLLVWSCGVAGTARANGSQCHVWITEKALEQVEGMDWAKAQKLRQAWVNGSVFPDGGYVIQHPYGETAHWAPFVSALVKRLRANPHKLTGDAWLRAKAFVLGVASHGMADQVFDENFMPLAELEDAEGWASGLFTSLDSMSDVMLAAQDGPVAGALPWWPADEVMPVFTDLGVAVSQTAIDDGQDSMMNVVLAYGATAAKSVKAVQAADARYPWSSKHLLDQRVAGSMPCEAWFVARYLEAIDAQLANKQVDATLLGSIPRHGYQHHPRKADAFGSQVYLAFSHGIDAARAQPGDVQVVDGNGQAVPVTLHWRGNTLRVRPVADWPQKAWISVQVTKLRTIDGAVLKQPVEIRFAARPLSGGQQTPVCGPPIETVPTPEGSADGGDDATCSAGFSRRWHPRLAWLVLASMALLHVFRSRRRQATRPSAR